MFAADLAAARTIVAISGGLGGARLALGLQAAGLDGDACIITNVADDVRFGPLVVCPDTDAVLYALSGCLDEERGWGVRGDEFDHQADWLPPWFAIGRRDAEHHAWRTALLEGGATPAQATAAMASALRIRAAVVPATDDYLRTFVRVDGRWLSFQEWLVRDGAPPVERVTWCGTESARPAPGLLRALERAELVVLASSSPVASIAPTLALAGVREALTRRRGRTVAISPVAVHRLITSARDACRAQARRRLLAAVGVGHTPVAIAGWYSDIIDAFVIDPADAADASRIAALGVEPIIAPVVGAGAEERAELVAALVRS